MADAPALRLLSAEMETSRAQTLQIQVVRGREAVKLSLSVPPTGAVQLGCFLEYI